MKMSMSMTAPLHSEPGRSVVTERKWFRERKRLACLAEQVSGAFIGEDSRGGESRTFALATTWRSCSNRESGACGDADTLAIAD
jgi:hypothetical protein